MNRGHAGQCFGIVWTNYARNVSVVMRFLPSKDLMRKTRSRHFMAPAITIAPGRGHWGGNSEFEVKSIAASLNLRRPAHPVFSVPGYERASNTSRPYEPGVGQALDGA